jgi:putative DNA primase/helicase
MIAVRRKIPVAECNRRCRVVKGCVVLPADTTLSDWDEFYRHYGESISRIVFNQQLPANLRS